MMKCKYCGYEVPVIARYDYEEEFIYTKDCGDHLEPGLKCPRCDKEQ